MTDFEALLRALCAEGVRFIVVGGAAATAHGSARLTNDLDVVYARDTDNTSRLVRALAPFHPYLRGAPPGLPFVWDERTITHGLNFTLDTAVGAIDVLGEIVAGGRYEDLAPRSVTMELFGASCLCLGVEALIANKRAVGRPKDLETIAELELILEAAKRRGE
jgi:hypothetical protein